MIKLPKIKNIKKDLEACIKSTAIRGTQNIKDELTKRGQDSNVTFSVNKDKITFTIVPKIDKVDPDKLSGKEAAKFKKMLGPIPIEMLTEQMSQQEFPEIAIDKGIERTQDYLEDKVDEIARSMI